MPHNDIEGSEILTCRQIGLDCQSHYAHEGVTAEVFLSPELSHLGEGRLASERYGRDQSKRAYIIKHRGCNKQIGNRVSDKPGLIGIPSQLEMQSIFLARRLYQCEDLQGSFTGKLTADVCLPRLSRGLRNKKQRMLT